MVGSSSFPHLSFCRSRTEVCGSCLVGEFVPVFRPSRRLWNFGQVIACRSNEYDSQFCLLFGTGTDREWVDVHTKPFDAYVFFHRTGGTTPIVVLPEPHVIDEPAYDDTPIPLGNSPRCRYSFQIPLAPVQTSTRTSRSEHGNGRLTGAGAYQSYWSVPYYQRDYVPPDRHRENLQENDIQHSPRLWTVDVSC
jgi:hypothetical protein